MNQRRSITILSNRGHIFPQTTPVRQFFDRMKLNKNRNIQFLIILLVMVSVSSLSYLKNASLATWVSGSDTTNENGIYGTKGVPDLPQI